MPESGTARTLARYVLAPAMLLVVGLIALFMRTQQRQYYAECRQVCAAAGKYYVEQIVLPPFHAPECRCIPRTGAPASAGG